MVDMKSVLILMLELLLTVLIVQGQLSLGIEPATRYTGATLTVTCDVRSITTIGVNIFKDTDQLYTCLFTNAPCSDRDDLSDYADVDWSQTGKAVVIISNADSTRDDGVWTCSGDDTTQKSNEISLIITDRTTTVSTTTVLTTTVPTTTALETNDEDLYWLFLLLLIICVGLVIVIVIVSRYKTLVINKLHLEVTKNTVHLSWEPKFEHVPPNTYAKCAQNSLMTYAKYTNRSVVIEFEDLTPDRKHDVTIYCQNQANMKLYKSEEFVVFTLKDSSNTIPKESKTVSLH